MSRGWVEANITSADWLNYGGFIVGFSFCCDTVLLFVCYRRWWGLKEQMHAKDHAKVISGRHLAGSFLCHQEATDHRYITSAIICDLEHFIRPRSSTIHTDYRLENGPLNHQWAVETFCSHWRRKVCIMCIALYNCVKMNCNFVRMCNLISEMFCWLICCRFGFLVQDFWIKISVIKWQFIWSHTCSILVRSMSLLREYSSTFLFAATVCSSMQSHDGSCSHLSLKCLALASAVHFHSSCSLNGSWLGSKVLILHVKHDLGSSMFVFFPFSLLYKGC